MDIPEIDPDEIVHLGKREMDEMSDEELRCYVHDELEVKAYVLEGTVKALKAGGVEGLGNDEKAALIDARPGTSRRRSSSTPWASRRAATTTSGPGPSAPTPTPRPARPSGRSSSWSAEAGVLLHPPEAARAGGPHPYVRQEGEGAHGR